MRLYQQGQRYRCGRAAYIDPGIGRAAPAVISERWQIAGNFRLTIVRDGVGIGMVMGRGE
ncbi:hypothetical protein D3C76_1738350 [compost metagenome]